VFAPRELNHIATSHRRADRLKAVLQKTRTSSMRNLQNCAELPLTGRPLDSSIIKER